MMNKNIFTMFGFLAILVLSLTVVSADPNGGDLKMSIISKPANVTNTSTSLEVIFNLTNTGLSHDVSLVSQTSTGTWTFNQTSPITVEKYQVIVIKGTLTFPTQLAGTTITSTINATSGTLVPGQIIVSVPVVSDSTAEDICGYCEEGCSNVGDLAIKKLEFNLVEGIGDEDDGFYPSDEVEVTFTVDNQGDWDIEDIELKMCLYDVDADNCIYDEGDFEITEDDFDLDKGDDLEVTAAITLDPSDLESGNTDYLVWVTATGAIDDKDSAYDADPTCESADETLGILTDEDFVIINDIVVEPQTANAGSTVQVSAKVWNIGDTDLDNDEVFVVASNSDLGLNKVLEFDSGIDSFDYEIIEFSFQVPEGLEEKTYKIEFAAYEDESLADKYIFENSEDDEAIYYGYLKTLGSPVKPVAPSIRASLDSVAGVAQELTIKALITNNAEDNDFTISVSGFEAWADLVSVEPQSANIAKGQTSEVVVKLMPKVGGLQSFNVNAIADGETYNQSISVNIEQKETLFMGVSDTVTYLVIGILVLLVLIILILIIKAFSRPKRKVEF